MSTSLNPFDLLGEDDSDDISKLVAVAKQKASAAAESDKKEDVPSKNQQPGKDDRNESQGGRGGGRGQGTRGGRGRGGRGSDRGFLDDVNSNSSYNGYSGGFDGAGGQEGRRLNERRGGYGGGRGGNHGGRNADFGNGEVNYDNERPARRTFERHSGSHSASGRGSDVKRQGTGRGNWGTTEDDIVVEPKELVNEWDKTDGTEKELVNEWDKPVGIEKNSEETVQDEKKDAHVTESFENKELSDEQKQWIADRKAERLAEEKQKTLDEYEKEREERRKALPTVKSEERKVDVEAFNSMKLLLNKKKDEEVFVKLGTDKEKRKEVAVADKAKRSVKTNEFLKLGEGVNSYRSGGRGGGGGGRGRGGRDSNNVEATHVAGGRRSPAAPAAPSIADAGQFPTLGAKK